ncbi:MAG: hypothetical protein AB7V22_02705 [Kiritimatiellia bacterium]
MRQDFKREHVYDFYNTLDSIGAYVRITKIANGFPNYDVEGASRVYSDIGPPAHDYYAVQLPVAKGHRIKVTERLTHLDLRLNGYLVYGWPKIRVSDPLPLCINSADAPIHPLLKETTGLSIPWNINDSDGDDIPDLNDEYVEGNDPELVKMQIRSPDGLPVEKIESDCGGTIVRLYERQTKKYGDSEDAIPARLGANLENHTPYKGFDDDFIYVEGVSLGSAVLTLTGKGGITDRIKLNVVVKVEFDHAKVNTRNLTHADDDSPDYEHCVADIWDSSSEVNLEDFLTAESLTFKDYIDWYVDGTKQSSSTLNFGSEPGNNEIKDYEVHVTDKDMSTICDRLILVIVPTSTEQAHNDWVTTWSANTAWLAELPAAYSSITFNAFGDPEYPEPGTCTNEYWEGSVEPLDSYYHPGATFQMRSEETPGGHGHQVCYTGAGAIITSGVAAGTADSHHHSDYWPPSHVTVDVLPFVRAAQLDGNPVFVNDLVPTNFNRPMMYEGAHLQQYLQLRPPMPNSKPLLTPGTCAP